MKTALALLLSLFVALFAAGSRAQELGPEELVKKVTADVLEAIKSDKSLQAGDRRKSLALAEEKVLPHVDFKEAAQLAVGKIWWSATPVQQERIANEFRSLLVRIYANAVDTYRGQTMQVMPVRMPAGATEVTVRNRYLKPGTSAVPVDYAMKKTPAGWKIYDITVEGVSLVLTYRSEFEQVTRASGIEGLIRKLAEKNA